MMNSGRSLFQSVLDVLDANAQHGAGDIIEIFFISLDVDCALDVRDTFLPWTEIDGGLRRVRAASVLFLSDCCHAGAFGSRGGTSRPVSPTTSGSAVVFVATGIHSHDIASALAIPNPSCAEACT